MTTREKFHSAQQSVIFNVAVTSMGRLRALVQNPSFVDHDFVNYYVEHVVDRRLPDNGEAVTVLLHERPCSVDSHSLEDALKHHYVNIAAALQNDDRFMEEAGFCSSCKANIACIDCANKEAEGAAYDHDFKMYCCTTVLLAGRLADAARTPFALRVSKTACSHHAKFATESFAWPMKTFAVLNATSLSA